MKIKPIHVVILAVTLGAGECLGEGEKHIEFRQYQETPALVGHAWDVATASTATVTTYRSFSFFDFDQHTKAGARRGAAATCTTVVPPATIPAKG